MGEVRLAGAVELGVGEFVEEDVSFAIEHAMALLDHGDADGLRQVTLPRARPAEKEPVFPLGDEAAGGELEDEGPVHLRVEVEIEGVEGLAGIAKARLLEPALEEPILAFEQLVLDKSGEEVDRGELLGLGLEEPALEAGGHAGAAELAERPLQLDERHVGTSWVFCAITAR